MVWVDARRPVFPGRSAGPAAPPAAGSASALHAPLVDQAGRRPAVIGNAQEPPEARAARVAARVSRSVAGAFGRARVLRRPLDALLRAAARGPARRAANGPAGFPSHHHASPRA